MLENLGLKNIEIVPVVADISHGIQATRNEFSSCWFDEAGCKEGIVHLESYRKKWNRTTERFSDTPIHNIHSEGADAFRQFGQSRNNESGGFDFNDDDFDDYKGDGGWMA